MNKLKKFGYWTGSQCSVPKSAKAVIDKKSMPTQIASSASCGASSCNCGGGCNTECGGCNGD